MTPGALPAQDRAETCDLPCDGETHYTGERDPSTGEDIEAGPCPHWRDTQAVAS